MLISFEIYVIFTHMKKVAFFIALMVGLSASPSVRRPEEEEGIVIELKEGEIQSSRRQGSIIHRVTDKIAVYFYAITKEGRFDVLSWDRISGIFRKKDTYKRKAVINKKKSEWILFVHESSMDNDEKSFRLLNNNT